MAKVSELLSEAKDLAKKAQTAVDENKEKYQAAAKKGLEAVEQVKDLLEKLKSGDHKAVELALTEWADVNRTLEAVQRMDDAIIRAKSGVQAEDVANFIGKSLKIALTIGMAL